MWLFVARLCQLLFKFQYILSLRNSIDVINFQLQYYFGNLNEININFHKKPFSQVKKIRFYFFEWSMYIYPLWIIMRYSTVLPGTLLYNTLSFQRQPWIIELNNRVQANVWVVRTWGRYERYNDLHGLILPPWVLLGILLLREDILARTGNLHDINTHILY